MDAIAKELNVSKLEDWYKVTDVDVIKRGGSSLLYNYRGSLKNGL
jgi:hypothetical protein